MTRVLDAPSTEPSSTRRTKVAFVAWGAVPGRSKEIAAEVGGEAVCFFPPGGRRPPVLVRWALSAIRTAALVLTRRPEVVIVTNPPVFAPLVAYACARVVGARVIMDSHPGGFGAQGDRVAARLQFLHRWLAARVDAVLVTEEHWSGVVRGWGGTPLVVHEAPAHWVCSPGARHGRLRALVVGRFGPDEPVEAVFAAAAMAPSCDFLLTGDPARCPERLRRSAGPNVEFVGYLDADAYRAALRNADVVVTLTTEPTSVMRAAYEAVYAGRPLVVSDWPVARRLFAHARLAINDGPGVARALLDLERDYEATAAGAAHARRRQLERWATQRAALIEAIEGRG